MNITLKLAKLYLSQIFSIVTLKDGFTKGGKKLLKSIGIILIILYCISVFGFMYVSIAKIFYEMFASQGMPQLYPLMLGYVILAITFLFGFLTTLGTYTSLQNEELLLSLPMTDKQLFLSKYISTSLCELPISLVFIAIGAFIYGKNEGLLSNPLLYVSILIDGVTMPLIILAVCFALVIVILNVFSFLKNKSFLIGVSTTLLLVVLLTLNFSYQNLMISAVSNTLPAETLISASQKMTGIGQILLPVKWFAESFSSIGKSTGDVLLKLLLLIVTGGVFSFLILPLLSPIYRKTVIGFNETTTKRLSKDKIDSFIKGDIKSTPILKAMLIRDFKSLMREPTWLTNGPLVIFIMPLIIVISIYVGLRGNGGDNVTFILDSFRDNLLGYIEQGETAKNAILYGAAGITSICAIFTGCNTFVASSAISREGKGLSNLMALPVSWKTIFTAKMLHAMIYSVFTTILAVVVMTIAFVFFRIPLSGKDIVLTYTGTILLSLSFSFVLQILSLFVDVKHPKLDWENPSAAMKRNTNTLLAMLITMGTTAILIAAGVFLLPMRIETIIVLAVVITGLAVLLWKWFLDHAPKALYRQF